jgi:solute carrier family 9B (sodium/hydrogen exchanger), member 1/2
LIVVLLRAGLSLDLKDLAKIGRPAFLMSFLPKLFEIREIVLIALYLLNISILDAAILVSVLVAVSPAVVVPRMLHLMEQGYGHKNKIPQLIMAGASLDDIFVIILFTSFVTLRQGQSIDFSILSSLPISILTGIGFGFIFGYSIVLIFKRIHMRDTVKVLLLLSISFLLLGLEKDINLFIPYSALLSVMALGISILKFYPVLAHRITSKFSKIWVGAEVFFVYISGNCSKFIQY